MKLRALTVAGFILTLVVLGSFSFMYIEGRTLFESFYFVIATMTTVGYGDIVPTTDTGRVLSIFLIVFGAGAVLAIIPLLFSYVVEKDIRSVLGIEKVPKLRNHVIICKYNELAEQALEDIEAQNIPYIIIEHDEERVERLREMDMPYIHGDPSEDRVLVKAMVEAAASIILASRNDSENTFIAIAARQLNPVIKIIARVDSNETVPIFKKINVDVVINPQDVTLKSLVKNALAPYVAELFDEISLFKNVGLGQFQVSGDSKVAGKRVLDADFKAETGASVVAILRGDEMLPNPPDDTIVHENDVLLVLGTSRQLQSASMLIECCGAKGIGSIEGHVIICGFGHNGKGVAKELDAEGVEYVIIERNKETIEELYGIDEKTRYVGSGPSGNGASKQIIMEDAKKEETLEKAGIAEAKALVIAISDDAEAAFITLIARTLNSSLPIITKANRLESMRKIYKAGATKVISPSVIGGKMAARAAIKPLVAEFVDRITLMKGFEIAQFKIGRDSGFFKKTLADLKLSEKNVSVLAIHQKGELLPNPPPDLTLDDGDIMVVLGSGEELREISQD